MEYWNKQNTYVLEPIFQSSYRFYFGSQATRTILESIVQTQRISCVPDRR